MIDKYIKFLLKNNYSKNTIKTYSSILKKYKLFLPDIRNVKKCIKQYFDSPNTAQLHYNVLFSYLKWTKDKRLEELSKIKLPPVPYKYLEVFSKQFLEHKVTIKDTDSDDIKNKKYTIKFLFETGIRADEIRNIISVSKSTLTIIGKGNKTREIFYNSITFKNMSPFVFTTKTLRLWVKEILGKKYTPHSIRRSHATHMLLKGASPKVVMLQLGHAKIETTFRYLQISLKENKKQYDKYF